MSLQAYVINLKRREDRLLNFNKTCPYNNVIRFNAIDKNNIKQDYLSKELYSDEEYSSKQKIIYKNFKNLLGGEIGCFLSHVVLWEKIVQSFPDDTNVIIFEDDVIFCDNFNEKLDNIVNILKLNKDMFKTVLYLGGRFEPNFMMKTCIPVIDNIVKYDYTQNWIGSDCDRGTYAYIINKNCAKLFLENIDNNEFNNLAVDHYMMCVLRKYKKDILHINPLLCWSKLYGDSDIR